MNVIPLLLIAVTALFFMVLLAFFWLLRIDREVAQQGRRIADLRPKPAGLRTGPHPRLKAIVK